MDNNMKLLAEIASYFSKFSCGGDPLEGVCHTVCVPKVIIIAIAFSGPPSKFLPCYAHVHSMSLGIYLLCSK